MKFPYKPLLYKLSCLMGSTIYTYSNYKLYLENTKVKKRTPHLDYIIY